jgi:2-dehydro-3-deoxygalactonokinase
MDSDFLSCDWGTTSFRLRWISGADRRVVREIREQAGVKSLYEKAVSDGAATEAARAPVFGAFLRIKLEALVAEEKAPAHPLPLVISGMASSSIGWRELPYGKSPSPLDASGLRAEELHWEKPAWIGPTYLISGLATECEMMRGEETEIIGLMAESSLASLRENCRLILPGTHSKHVRIENQTIVDWHTFMTGELFEVLGGHSLLRASIDLNTRPGAAASESERAAFYDGVRYAQKHGLGGALFRVRTRAVLGRRPLRENTWFFSGLLIGAELSEISSHAEKRPIILAATHGLSALYALALEMIAGQSIQWIKLPPEQMETSTVSAHALFLKAKA